MSDGPEIKSLDGVDMEALHHSQTIAFGDYPVDVQMSVGELEQLLNQNSVSLACSAGAFAGQDLPRRWSELRKRLWTT